MGSRLTLSWTALPRAVSPLSPDHIRAKCIFRQPEAERCESNP